MVFILKSENVAGELSERSSGRGYGQKPPGKLGR